MTVNFISPTTQDDLLFSKGDQRILALYFPYLPTDRIARRLWGLSWRLKERPDHPPILCAGRRDNGLQLTALDDVGRSLGLRRGQGLAEVRAMYPAVDVFDEDKKADQGLLEAIADWCDRYTPLVALDGNDGLFLDVTGCAHLFGGEEVMLDDALTRLGQMGFAVSGAISPAPGLSWAVSRFGRGGVIARKDMKACLGGLPVHGLRIGEAGAAALSKLGLKRIGDLMSMPRAPLARRFGPELLLRLDQALGVNEEAISPRRPVAELSAERKLAEPIVAEDDILAITCEIAVSLKLNLEARELGGLAFELVLFRVDGRVFRVSAGASQPLRDPRRISGLFAERLACLNDELDAGFGFELLRLNVLRHDNLVQVQDDLGGGGKQNASLAEFIDKVSARLGPDCLQVFRLRQSHIPERVEIRVSALLAGEQAPQGHETLPFMPRSDRPVLLLRRPEPMEAFTATVPDGPPLRFRWRHVVYHVTRAEGPERITPEWWLGDSKMEERDYFRLESEDGRLFWIYRFGRYDNDTPPEWRVHGVFA